ncbi:MAG TPA: TonB-dependent receptor [bacterium]|nr:TonB-dependent receptor [bacterium]HPR88465.1 TonB-dependent receptor [bacterium]
MASRYRTQKMLCALLLTAFLLTSGVVSAATTGKIAGKVIDLANNSPLPGANVQVVGTSLGAITDPQGEFFIINVPPGTYSVKTSMMGYKTMTQTGIKVAIDLTSRVNFKMEATVIPGQEITIVAERPIVEKDVTGSQQVMDASALQRAPVLNLGQALSQKSGFYSTGITTYVRSGVASEVNYRLDGMSLNSGLLSDNYQRLNNSAIQEVSVLTGGYNAEYGDAMSGVVNVVTKEAASGSKGVHGSINYRIRPAGQYHWGDNMYSEKLWKYNHFNKEFWASQLADPTKATGFAQYYQRFYGWDGSRVPTADELLATYRKQITPNSILGDYTKRPEQDVEVTLYGGLSKKMNFLISGRYKKAVNIFPQAQEYNPDYNVQAKLNYDVAANKKLTLNLMRGYYKSATFTESNWNNYESSEEARWQPNADVRSPYDNQAYAPWGGYWLKGPETKNFNVGSLKWQHVLNPSTFYTVQLSYLYDYMTQLQDYDKFMTSETTVPWGDSWFDLGGNFRLESRQIQVNNYSTSKVFSAKGDFTSQVHKAHQIKTGAEFKLYDLDYQHYYMEFPAGDVWHLDNVFAGKPYEGSMYVQDKMEYSGIILNVGLRLDAFNANHNYPENMYDPLGFEPWNGGVDGAPSNTANIWQATKQPKDWFAVKTDYASFFAGKLQDKNTLSSEFKFALAPRLGLSFPITDNSKLRFSYGHFFQRPSWSKILGFPTSWYESNPYATVRMDQWQGWYGQPGLTYEKTIQYELGFDQNLFNVLRLMATAYYKDMSRLTHYAFNGTYNVSGGSFADIGWGAGNVETQSYTRNITNDGHDLVFYANDAYKDIRGVEVTLEKLFQNNWNADLTFNYGLSSGGTPSYWQYNEDASIANPPRNYFETKTTWLSDITLKGSIAYLTPREFGPLGLLGNLTMGLYHEYFAGPQYTYYPKNYTGLKVPNNKRWYPHNRTDLKLSKRIAVGRYAPVLGIEVFNLFNNYDRNLSYLGGTDMDNWQEKKTIPRVSQSGESNTWWFYNSVSNPKRMIYFSLGLDL